MGPLGPVFAAPPARPTRAPPPRARRTPSGSSDGRSSSARQTWAPRPGLPAPPARPTRAHHRALVDTLRQQSDGRSSSARQTRVHSARSCRPSQPGPPALHQRRFVDLRRRLRIPSFLRRSCRTKAQAGASSKSTSLSAGETAAGPRVFQTKCQSGRSGWRSSQRNAAWSRLSRSSLARSMLPRGETTKSNSSIGGLDTRARQERQRLLFRIRSPKAPPPAGPEGVPRICFGDYWPIAARRARSGRPRKGAADPGFPASTPS